MILCAALTLIGVCVFHFTRPRLVAVDYAETELQGTVAEVVAAHGMSARSVADLAAQAGVLDQLHILSNYMDLDRDERLSTSWPSRIRRRSPNLVEIQTESNCVYRIDTGIRRIQFALDSYGSCQYRLDLPPVTSREMAFDLAQCFIREMSIEVELRPELFESRPRFSSHPEEIEWGATLRRRVDGCSAPSFFRIVIDGPHGTVRSFSDIPLEFVPERKASFVDAKTAYTMARKALFPFWARPFVADAHVAPWLAVQDIGTNMDQAVAYVPPYADGVRYVWEVPVTAEEEGHMPVTATVDAETGRVYSYQACL